MYYVLGILCIYSSASFVEKQKSKTDMPNSNEFDEYFYLTAVSRTNINVSSDSCDRK